MTIVLDGSSGISMPDGSAIQPAIKGSSSSTGIFYGNNEVLIATNGVERLKITANGSIVTPGGNLTASSGKPIAFSLIFS